MRQDTLAGYAAADFADQDGSTAFALRGGFCGLPAGDRIFILTDILREATIHERRVLQAQLFVPRAVVDLRGEDLLKSAGC